MIEMIKIFPEEEMLPQARIKYHRCFSLIVRIFKLFLLFCSILSGVLFAVVWRNYEQAVLRITTIHSPLSSSNLVGQSRVGGKDDWITKLDDKLQHSQNYEQWLAKNFRMKSVPIPHEDISYNFHNTSAKYLIESEFLSNQTNVFCMVLSSTRTRSRALNNTWTKHCNERMFYGLHHEMKIPYVKLNPIDDSLLSPRTFCLGFIDALDRMAANDSQWLLITTDQTYAIVENLRYMAAPLDHRDRFYIGRPVHHYFLGVYNSFDSGIVLSRGTVDLLANTVFHNRSACLHLTNTNSMVYGGQFDSYIGMHLLQYGVRPENSLDGAKKRGTSPGGTRFHPFMPEKHLNPHLISVFDTYWSSNLLPIIGGFGCCSDHAITFTGFSPVTMYFIEYIIYHLAAFTQFDGPKGLGNWPPPYQSYQVSSDLDGQQDDHAKNQATVKDDDYHQQHQHQHHHHYHHHQNHHRRKRRKHRKEHRSTRD